MSCGREKRLWLVAIAAACLLLAWLVSRLGGPAIELLPPDGALRVAPSVAAEPTSVARVIDGDTVQLADGRVVRYLGIDCPERDEPFYRFAAELNRRLVRGKAVGLIYDQERRDRYDRLLCYVIDLDTRLLINGEMIRHGAAFVYTVRPNVRYHEQLAAVQRSARRERRGLWAEFREGDESHYVASVGGYRFHRPSCEAARGIPPKNRIELNSRAEAFDRGLSPCRNCRP